MTNKLKFGVFVLLCIGLSINNVLGAVVSGTAYTTKNGNFPDGWTATNKTNNYCRLLSGEVIETDEFCATSFSSISLTARTYGGVEASKNKITVYWVDTDASTTTSLGTVTPTSNSDNTYNISSPASITANHTGYIRIKCAGANNSKGAGVASVTINYSSDGCSGSTYTVVFVDTPSQEHKSL